MNRIIASLRRIDDELTTLGRSFAVVGGLAVSVRGAPRLTRDVDIAVAVTDDRDAEALVHHLQSRGYEMTAMLEQEAVGRLATVRLRDTSSATIVDLLFASSGIEPEITSDAEAVEIIPGVVVRVARREHLLATKVLARDDRHRPQDYDDIRAMLERADEGEIERSRELLRLIARRGCARGKDLVAELDTLVAIVRSESGS